MGRKAIEVMKEKGIYSASVIGKMIKEMKKVSKNNQGKSTLGKQWKTHDDTDEEEGGAEEWGRESFLLPERVRTGRRTALWMTLIMETSPWKTFSLKTRKSCPPIQSRTSISRT